MEPSASPRPGHRHRPIHRPSHQASRMTRGRFLAIMGTATAGLLWTAVWSWREIWKDLISDQATHPESADDTMKLPDFLRNYLHPESPDEEREMTQDYQMVKNHVYTIAHADFESKRDKYTPEMFTQFTDTYKRVLLAYEFVKKGYRTPEDFLGALQGGNNYFCDSHVDIVVKKHPQKPSTIPPRHLWIPDGTEDEYGSGHMVAFRQKNLDLK